MCKTLNLSREIVQFLLNRFRAVDICLAVKVYSGNSLDPCPSHEELRQPAARIFWLTAFIHFAQSQSHSGLRLDASIRLSDYFGRNDFPDTFATLTVVDIVGTIPDLVAGFPGKIVESRSLLKDVPTPFVYRREASLIYLRRWYMMEAELGGIFRSYLSLAPASLEPKLAGHFRELFKGENIDENPWQAVACFAAIRHRFVVITGGPGTGKTTTISRLIALLLSLPEVEQPQQIAMVAPTGKAAERMREAFAENWERMLKDLPFEYASVLRSLASRRIAEASTIHSLLESRGLSGFAKSEKNPLSCDVLIVDEATMVDLELFLALLRAIPKSCRVVLLGDRNQLAAVETGNVFSDLTSSSDQRGLSLNTFSRSFAESFKEFLSFDLPQNFPKFTALCGDHVVELVKSYRFNKDSAVGRCARYLIEESRLPFLKEFESFMTLIESDWRAGLVESLQDYKLLLASKSAPHLLLEKLQETRILCAVKKGSSGTEAINSLLLEEVLGGGFDVNIPRHGMPFMISTNDRNLGVWNGDSGVFIEEAGGSVYAYLDRGCREKPLRIDAYALPKWETAFAITIHKSQGSEYDAVVLVLPASRQGFITWELIYTGVTRARKSLHLILPDNLIGVELDRTKRISGLVFELTR